MEIQNRLLRIVYSHKWGCLIASDVRGRVHKFDRDLRLVQSSPVVTFDRPVNAICISDEFIFTKDRFGSIGKWDFSSLSPLDFLDGRFACDRRGLEPDEMPSPSPNRGIAYLNGKIYTCNAYNQFVVIDARTFRLLEVRECPSKTFIDCICVDNPGAHILSDVVGNVFIGNLETHEYKVKKQVDTSVIHGVIYDKRHDRFWTTQDGGLGEDRLVRTGVTTIDADGSNFREFKLSHEDNEFIDSDPDRLRVFAGGFNGKVAVFDNTNREFFLSKVFGPLEFQIIHAAVVSPDRIYVLLQTGDLLLLDGNGNEVCRADNRGSCVWILEPHPEDSSLLYAGTDYGVALIRYTAGRFGSVQIEQIGRHAPGFGIVKDVKPLPDGSYVGISRKGVVFKADQRGAIQWTRQVTGVPRGVALSRLYERCLVATDEGMLWEFAVGDGATVDVLTVGSPAYACIYSNDDRRVVSADKGPEIQVYASDSHSMLGRINGFRFRLKRLTRTEHSKIFVTGPDGMFELDLDSYAIEKSFGAHMVSTKETGVLCGGYLYVGGYGYQLASYKYDDSQMVALHETLPDYTKAFAARIAEDGAPILLVGGRGGFICAYRVAQGVPHLTREFYVN